MAGRTVQDTRIGGRTDHWVTLPEGVDRLMLVPDEVRDCVAFVYRSTGGQRYPMGTAFFVAREANIAGIKINAGALVTAHHVFAGVRRKGDDGKVHIRINKRDDGSGTPAKPIWHEIPLSEWAEGHARGIDVAATVWRHDPSMNADYRAWPLTGNGLATAEVRKLQGIGVGDEVFMVGLFRNHLGADRNEPILRDGNIAAIPRDLIEVTGYGKAKVILIEARSIGGLSGSPVFVHMGWTRWRADQDEVVKSGTSSPFFLVGLLHGHWETKNKDIQWASVDDVDAPDGTPQEQEKIHTGIAIVIPADDMLSVIDEAIETEVTRGYQEAWEALETTPDSIEPDTTERDNFTDLLGKLAQVPKSEVDELRREERED